MAIRRPPQPDSGPKTALSALEVNRVLHDDCLMALRALPSCSVDAIVTDPPAGIAFMGKGWDTDKGGRDQWIAWLAEVMREALRVLKPGGHALVWALPRTSHWTATALEDAGFEVRDRLAHVFGSGFPKSLDVGKAIDKAAGAQREVVGEWRTGFSGTLGGKAAYSGLSGEDVRTVTAPATDAARQWDGWGTALKPAVEDWWLVRKPLAAPTVAANVLRYGTGALNIGRSRIESGRDYHDLTVTQGVNTARTSWEHRRQPRTFAPSTGRWPANLLLSHTLECAADGSACADGCPVAELDRQSGVSRSSARTAPMREMTSKGYKGGGFGQSRAVDHPYIDRVSLKTYEGEGGASRYFTTFRYQAKASRAERNRGCEGLPRMPSADWPQAGVAVGAAPRLAPTGNGHPTVKPLALMSWLIGLITPPGGLVLDPFAGSGSTLVAAKAGGWQYLGIEREAEYVAIAEARLAATEESVSLGSAVAITQPKPVTPAKPKRQRQPKRPPSLPLWETPA